MVNAAMTMLSRAGYRAPYDGSSTLAHGPRIARVGGWAATASPASAMLGHRPTDRGDLGMTLSTILVASEGTCRLWMSERFERDACPVLQG
jgi:hypothetical protein